LTQIHQELKMANLKKEWYFGDEENGQWIGPMSIESLDEDYHAGKFHDYTRVINSQMLRHDGPMAQGISYSMISRLNVEFTPTADEFIISRENMQTTILSGPNNSGKTLFLKQLFYVIGQGGYLINCNRFSHVDTLNTRATEEHEHRRYYENFIHSYNTSQQNTENNELQLQQIITSLKNRQRVKLFELAYELLGNKFSLKRIDPENEFSPFYVDMDGENLRYGSTGTRLLLTLLGTFLDERFTTILIDEPEIGLSPRIQARLAKFLYDPIQRKEYFPHLRQIYVATHSHLFLDRLTFSNNFLITHKPQQLYGKDGVEEGK
jgi:predicted ATPase